MPNIPEPKYEAYIIRPGNVGIQVHGFKAHDAALKAWGHLPPAYELQIPGGHAIALVGSIDSAHAVLPTGTWCAAVLPQGEFWTTERL